MMARSFRNRSTDRVSFSTVTDEPSKPKRSRKQSSRWKGVERELAAILGAHIVEDGEAERDTDGNPVSQRVPVTGRGRGNAPDIRHPLYALEIKHGKQVPKLLVEALDQATKSVRGDRIPMVIFHPFGGRLDESMVIVRIKDLPRLRREAAE